MNKWLLLLLMCCAFPGESVAQSTNADRMELVKLLEERKRKFDAYATSIEKRTGIFGNKTKKDMLASNNVLTEIVRIDNKIISVLNRTVDFKNYEKINMNYDVQAHADRVNQLLKSVYTLQKQVQVLQSNKTYLTEKLGRLQLVMIFLVTLSIALLLLLLKKMKTSSTKQS
jgi:hypothetical protein